MVSSIISRRRFIGRISLLGGALVTNITLSGCEKKSRHDEIADSPEPSDCSDLSGVSKNDKNLRQKLAYTDESPLSDSQCENCNLYLPPQKEKKCGGCILFKGPVHASGYCTYWAPKVDDNI